MPNFDVGLTKTGLKVQNNFETFTFFTRFCSEKVNKELVALTCFHTFLFSQ